MILSLSLGFFSVSGFGEYTFVGLDNYRRMLGDPLFWRSLRVTILYVVAARAAALCRRARARLACAARHPLQRRRRARCSSCPQTVSLVVVALVWQVLLVDKIGLFNQFGATFGIGSISWLGDPRFALYTVIVDQRLVPDGLLHADLSRRPAGHSQGILRSGANRRRRRPSSLSSRSRCRCCGRRASSSCSSRR